MAAQWKRKGVVEFPANDYHCFHAQPISYLHYIPFFIFFFLPYIYIYFYFGFLTCLGGDCDQVMAEVYRTLPNG
jgi:hypothetical protein